MSDTIIVDGLASEPHVSPVAPSADVKTQEPADFNGLSLDELNATLGKTFKNKGSALKALKDTFSYVGMKTEQVESTVIDKGYMSRADVETEFFYRDNPQYKANKSVIDSFAAANGLRPEEAVKHEALSGLFAKVEKADSYESEQSVIATNPRLVATKSGFDKARENIIQNGRMTDTAESLIAKGVLEAFES